MRILMVHPQLELVEKFAYFLKERAEIVGFQDPKACLAYLKQGNSCDGIVLDESFRHQPLKWSAPLLVGSSHQHRLAQDEICYFQSLEAFWSDLVQKFSAFVDQPVPPVIRGAHKGKTDKQVLLFLGARGNVGTSRLALTCAKILSQDHRVLYLNTLPFQEPLSQGKESFSQVIQTLSSRLNQDLSPYLLEKEGIFHFASPQDDYDYQALETADLIQLIDLSLSQLKMDVVVCEGHLLDLAKTEAFLGKSQMTFVIDKPSNGGRLRQYVKHLAMDKRLTLAPCYLLANRASPSSTQGFDRCIPDFPPGQEGALEALMAEILGGLLWH